MVIIRGIKQDTEELKAVLIDKGIITTQELKAKKEKLKNNGKQKSN